MSVAHDKAPPSTTGTPPKRGLPRGLVRLGLIVTGAVLLAVGGVWWFLTPAPAKPADQLAKALALIDLQKSEEARVIAKDLEEAAYRDPEFAGAVEYVLGMAAFQLAEQSLDDQRIPQYTTAATYLKEAGTRGLPDARRPGWSFALGKTLHTLDDLDGALPLLEAAIAVDATHKVEASLLIGEITLQPEDRTPARLKRALSLVEDASELIPADDPLNDRAELIIGELLVESGITAEAQTIAERLAQRMPQRHAANVLLAQVRIAEKRFEDAIQLLETVANDEAADAALARRALFLIGWAAEQHAATFAADPTHASQAAMRDEFRQRAQDDYQKAIDHFERTPDGLAALVHIGQLQLEAGAHEKALKSFGTALRMVPRTEGFHNRWMTVEQFRIRMLAAWNGWNQIDHFAEAISLAELMTPLFPRAQADELAAQSQERWALSMEEELNRGTATVRAQRTAALRQKWCDSGAAFARLAAARKSPSERTDSLWTSVNHYVRGHDFKTALDELNEVVANPVESMRPVALVRRGEVELNLDRLDDAERDLQEVIRTSPTSPTAFTAQYLYGVCRLERDDPKGAEQAWRKILMANELTPAAGEWRDALLATAKLQCDLAGLEHRKTLRREATPNEVAAAWTRLQEQSSSATRMLEEFLARYPTSAKFSEAQSYLGRALQLQADWQQRQWELAETDNARQQAKRQRDQLLNRALLQFEQLRDRLTAAARADKLDPAGRTLLVNVWFDYPTTCFQLGRFEDAIAAYSAAANQFPHDVRVLTAYLQMAHAYSMSGRPVEARSMLEQAQVILDQRQIPDAAFEAPTTTLTRTEWNEWLDRARQVQR